MLPQGQKFFSETQRQWFAEGEATGGYVLITMHMPRAAGGFRAVRLTLDTQRVRRG